MSPRKPNLPSPPPLEGPSQNRYELNVISCGHFWLIFSGITGIFWGALIGLMIVGSVNKANGMLAGIFIGWIVYHLVLLGGCLSIISKRANGYKTHS